MESLPETAAGLASCDRACLQRSQYCSIATGIQVAHHSPSRVFAACRWPQTSGKDSITISAPGTIMHAPLVVSYRADVVVHYSTWPQDPPDPAEGGKPSALIAQCTLHYAMGCEWRDLRASRRSCCTPTTKPSRATVIRAAPLLMRSRRIFLSEGLTGSRRGRLGSSGGRRLDPCGAAPAAAPHAAVS